MQKYFEFLQDILMRCALLSFSQELLCVFLLAIDTALIFSAALGGCLGALQWLAVIIAIFFHMRYFAFVTTESHLIFFTFLFSNMRFFNSSSQSCLQMSILNTPLSYGNVTYLFISFLILFMTVETHRCQQRASETLLSRDLLPFWKLNIDT